MGKKAYNLQISRLEYGSAEVMAETPEQAEDMAQELINAGMVDWFDYEVTDVIAEDIKESSREAGDDRTYIVTELCPHCDSEIEMCWNTDMQGFKAFCPVCGKRLMLCDECRHAEDNKGGRCDYDSKTDICFRGKDKAKEAGAAGGTRTGREAELKFLESYVLQSDFSEGICRDRLRTLWTDYCLHYDLDVDTAWYDYDLLALWIKIEKIGDGTSEWANFDDFECFMCKYLV